MVVEALMNRDVLFLLGCAIAAVVMLTNLVYIGVLAWRVREPVGRILFGSLGTLKLWIILVLGYFLAGLFLAHLLTPLRREIIRWSLLLYLLVQSCINLGAWEYWRRHPDRVIELPPREKV